jgi:hypothetical protein
MIESQRTRRASFRSQSREMRRERARLTSAANSVNKMTRAFVLSRRKERKQEGTAEGNGGSAVLLFISLYRGYDDARGRNRSCAASSASNNFRPTAGFLRGCVAPKARKIGAFPSPSLRPTCCTMIDAHGCTIVLLLVSGGRPPATACPLRAHCVPTACPLRGGHIVSNEAIIFYAYFWQY